jgi:hypothetical protein
MMSHEFSVILSRHFPATCNVVVVELNGDNLAITKFSGDMPAFDYFKTLTVLDDVKSQMQESKIREAIYEIEGFEDLSVGISFHYEHEMVSAYYYRSKTAVDDRTGDDW